MPQIRTAVRTGDTLAHERRAMLTRPPHILVTTPESLYILLTAEKSRAILRTVETVIVDEIHAVADDKRGAHLALSLERLKRLHRHARRCASAFPPRRSPSSWSREFLAGANRPDRVIVDIGHRRELDLAVEVPASELGAGRLQRNVGRNLRPHRRTRRAASLHAGLRQYAPPGRARRASPRRAAGKGRCRRAPRQPGAQAAPGGRDASSKPANCARWWPPPRSNWASTSAAWTWSARSARTRSIAVACSASAAPATGAAPFPRAASSPPRATSLLECAALVRAIAPAAISIASRFPKRRSTFWRSRSWPPAPPKIGTRTISSHSVRRAYPYRNLPRADFDAIVEMLSEGIAARRGRYGAYLHRDRVNDRLRGRRGSRLAAITSGGAIPENALYTVVATPEGAVVGTVDEDFAVESLAGDIMLLGNTSWRIRRVQAGTRAGGRRARRAPNVPFWRGEAPGAHRRSFPRSSPNCAKKSARLARRCRTRHRTAEARRRSQPPSTGSSANAASTMPAPSKPSNTSSPGRAVLGAVPSQTTVIAERFFDEGGGMQLVIHAPFGARINKAWGLALRKRFCRSFNFELQAAATDNGLNISLGEQHSFPARPTFSIFCIPPPCSHVLEQAVLASPLFTVRWRWDAGRALALLRFRTARKFRRRFSACAPTICSPSVFPAGARLPGKYRRRNRDSRSSAGPRSR